MCVLLRKASNSDLNGPSPMMYALRSWIWLASCATASINTLCFFPGTSEPTDTRLTPVDACERFHIHPFRITRILSCRAPSRTIRSLRAEETAISPLACCRVHRIRGLINPNEGKTLMSVPRAGMTMGMFKILPKSIAANPSANRDCFPRPHLLLGDTR
jgi:hypothetical protein